MSVMPSSAELLTPGGYMKSCRERAGVKLHACGMKLAPHFGGYSRAIDKVEALEANRPGDYAYLVTVLARQKVFPFEFGTFARLAAATCDPVPDGCEEA